MSPPPALRAPWKSPALSGYDSLFIIASTGEPRFKAPRDSCEKLLTAGGAATAEYLLAHRLDHQTPRPSDCARDLVDANLSGNRSFVDTKTNADDMIFFAELPSWRRARFKRKKAGARALSPRPRRQRKILPLRRGGPG